MDKVEASDRIYLDWAATAPLSAAAARAMAPYQDPAENMRVNGNANSLYAEGRAAAKAMEKARSVIARCVDAQADEVTFTSGATEADNTAVIGMSLASERYAALKGAQGERPRVIVSEIEHDAVYNAVQFLKAFDFEIDVLPVTCAGMVRLEDFEAALTPQTVLASVMLANNEVGSIQPIAQLAKVAHEKGVLFHTDAVQALGKIPVSFNQLEVDALSISGHKIGGPKGIGALVMRRGSACVPTLFGGGQEGGLRSGTQNVAGMVGFAAAAAQVAGSLARLDAERQRQAGLRDHLYASLCAYPRVLATVPCAQGCADYLPNIVSVCVKGADSSSLVLRFDKLGIAVAGGSACSAHSIKESRVLRAIGVDADFINGSLRVSIGSQTTPQEIECFLAAFDSVLSWQA